MLSKLSFKLNGHIISGQKNLQICRTYVCYSEDAVYVTSALSHVSYPLRKFYPQKTFYCNSFLLIDDAYFYQSKEQIRHNQLEKIFSQCRSNILVPLQLLIPCMIISLAQWKSKLFHLNEKFKMEIQIMRRKLHSNIIEKIHEGLCCGRHIFTVTQTVFLFLTSLYPKKLK